MADVTALAGWFGGNRSLGHAVGLELEACSWVGIPFAGSMAEVPHIAAQSILINDLHRHIVNLARVCASDKLRPGLIRKLRRKAFHPDELKAVQEKCKALEPGDQADPDLAEAYFVCCWMGRASKAGSTSEFNGGASTRWNANGGSSVVRFQSAIRMLGQFAKYLRRCAFQTMDALDFVNRCEDNSNNGIYCDPPFPGLGRIYRHNCGQTEAEERAWHTRLRDILARFKKTRVVCRFYDHPLIRELYEGWTWVALEGRTQVGEDSPEVLIMNGPSRRHPGLFA